mmetsp:Transcript_3255/g.7308  ORF Transcript_3255/g.7308 Transcript_3255/m.7308 type:complete len:182 (-) Transcript_3255:309-854(-)
MLLLSQTNARFAQIPFIRQSANESIYLRVQSSNRSAILIRARGDGCGLQQRQQLRMRASERGLRRVRMLSLSLPRHKNGCENWFHFQSLNALESRRRSIALLTWKQCISSLLACVFGSLSLSAAVNECDGSIDGCLDGYLSELSLSSSEFEERVFECRTKKERKKERSRKRTRMQESERKN